MDRPAADPCTRIAGRPTHAPGSPGGPRARGLDMADELRIFIGGEWVASEGGATFEATSPSTGEVIATLPEGTRGDARRAIDAARKAWPAWSGLSAFERADAMRRVA